MPFKDKTFFGGDERIRTTESKANGFTVRPIWPTLEHPHIFKLYLIKDIILIPLPDRLLHFVQPFDGSHNEETILVLPYPHRLIWS